MKDSAIQFPTYFAAIANKPDYRRPVARAANEIGAITDVARSASTDFESAIGLCRACVGDMMLGGFGRIVGIGSLAARSGVTTPMPTVRCFQIRFSVSSVS